MGSPGRAPSSVETATTGLVDPESTTTRSRFCADFIEALPILGHDYQDVLPLAAGVNDVDDDGNPNIHGSRDSATRYRFDGADTTDPATGTFGMNLSPLVVEEIDLVTAGAGAEHGRAMGGFAGVTTPTGGEAMAGRLAVFWRGSFLDGDGAGNDDVLAFDEGPSPFRDLRIAASLGGPIGASGLHFFLSGESVETERNAAIPLDDTRVSGRATPYLGKLSWQVDPVHRLDFMAGGDPQAIEGLGLDTLTSPDSGYSLDREGRLAQVRWRAFPAGEVAWEAAIARFEIGEFLSPDSSFFTPTDPISAELVTGIPGYSALYPCQVLNCSEGLGERRVSRIDAFTGRTTGPYNVRGDERRTRDTLRAEITWNLSGGLGDHRFRAGFEVDEEENEQDLQVNPVLFDATVPLSATGNAVTGFQWLTVARPSGVDRKVSNMATGLYFSDSWKPLPNLAVNFGLRYDREDIDAPGHTPFDPREDRAASIDLWSAVCSEAAIQHIINLDSNCSPTRAYDGMVPTGIFDNFLRTFRDGNGDGLNDVPPEVAALDIDGSGRWSIFGVEGQQIYKHLTRYESLVPGRFSIDTSHLAPRLGLSWDPWSDGRTRFFVHGGRYYDRLRADALRVDSGPDFLTFTFVPNASGLILPGSRSFDLAVPSIAQVDRSLETPHTDELTIGAQRQVLDAWSAGITFIRRNARDLLQDDDRNHFTCAQSGQAIGIDALAVCGEAGALDLDRFGSFVVTGPASGFRVPNGVEDLYNVNQYFNQILRVENSNRSDYTAWEITFERALYRNWQMNIAYTRSRVRGEATSFLALAGDDPSHLDHAQVALEFDQRHVVELQAAAHLPHRVVLGGAFEWSSGLPFSVIESHADLDSENHPLIRTIYPTGEANDRRNEATLQIDARLEKGFRCGRVDASGFLIVQNLLDSDDLRIESISSGGGTLVATRDFGRRFEIGAIFGF